VIVGSGTNQERILLGWNEENKRAGREPALPVYLTDDASGNLYIQSGRADVFLARSRCRPIKRRSPAKPAWWA
jgi:polar amino acid transport system substrate-binding protein